MRKEREIKMAKAIPESKPDGNKMDPFKKMVETVFESIGGKNKKVESYFDFSKLSTGLCDKRLVAPIFTEESIQNCLNIL